MGWAARQVLIDAFAQWTFVRPCMSVCLSVSVCLFSRTKPRTIPSHAITSAYTQTAQQTTRRSPSQPGVALSLSHPLTLTDGW